jgi:hypothetical protein
VFVDSFVWGPTSLYPDSADIGDSRDIGASELSPPASDGLPPTAPLRPTDRLLLSDVFVPSVVFNESENPFPQSPDFEETFAAFGSADFAATKLAASSPIGVSDDRYRSAAFLPSEFVASLAAKPSNTFAASRPFPVTAVFTNSDDVAISGTFGATAEPNPPRENQSGATTGMIAGSVAVALAVVIGIVVLLVYLALHKNASESSSTMEVEMGSQDTQMMPMDLSLEDEVSGIATQYQSVFDMEPILSALQDTTAIDEGIFTY